MVDLKHQLQFLMEGGAVHRYHTRPGIEPDTNAQHSHGVAMLCALLMPPNGDGRTTASTQLLMAALTHDLGEQYVGDVSAPAKRTLGLREQLAQLEAAKRAEFNMDYEGCLNEQESIVLELADRFDGLLYCCRELALGNRRVILVWRRYCAYIESLTGTLPFDISLRAAGIYDAIVDIYKETISASGPEFDIFS